MWPVINSSALIVWNILFSLNSRCNYNQWQESNLYLNFTDDSHPSAQIGHLFGIYFLKKLSSHLHCPCPQLLPLEEKRALICARLHPARSTLYHPEWVVFWRQTEIESAMTRQKFHFLSKWGGILFETKMENHNSNLNKTGRKDHFSAVNSEI